MAPCLSRWARATAWPLCAAIDPFPHLRAWRARIKERPAVQRAVDLGKEWRRQAPPDEAERKLLFEQSAASLRSFPGENG